MGRGHEEDELVGAGRLVRRDTLLGFRRALDRAVPYPGSEVGVVAHQIGLCLFVDLVAQREVPESPKLRLAGPAGGLPSTIDPFHHRLEAFWSPAALRVADPIFDRARNCRI